MSVTGEKTARAIFLGAPGAGKGTQARLLAEQTGAVHISTGDMLRDHVARDTELGRQAQEFMAKGELVPDDLIIAMVNERIAQADAGAAWILDGFPRTLTQARALDRSLGDPGSGSDTAVSHVIYFEVPTRSLVRRLSGRRTCSACGAIWHVDFNPTKAEGVCDQCGGELVQRPDDRPEAITQRLEVYRTETEPLLEYYRARNVLVELAADRAPEQVHSELVEVLQ